MRGGNTLLASHSTHLPLHPRTHPLRAAHGPPRFGARRRYAAPPAAASTETKTRSAGAGDAPAARHPKPPPPPHPRSSPSAPPSVSAGGKGHRRGETRSSKDEPPSTRAGAVTLTGASASPPQTAEERRGRGGCTRTPGAVKASAGADAAASAEPRVTAWLARPFHCAARSAAAGTLAVLTLSDTPAASAAQPERRRAYVKGGARGLATGPTVALRTATACHAADACAGPPSAPVSEDGGAGA